MLYPDRFIEDQDLRQAYLEKLYDLDGRNDPSHPYHATFTALYINRRIKLLDQDISEVLELND